MIDDKKIEEAATVASISDTEKGRVRKGYVINALADHENGFREGYIEGAKWAINEFLKDLWHPNTEEPDKSKSDIITLGYYDDAYLQFKESIIWNKESWRHSISRNHIIEWAYLSDILPRKEEKNNDSRRVCKT